MTGLLVALFAPHALAQQERLLPAAASLSAEDGAAAAWVNPANLGFDQDPELGVYFRQDLVDQEDTSVAIATSGGGTSLGLLFRTDNGGTPWWGLNSGFSVRLPQHFRLGANLTWNLPQGSGNNFVAWDLGLSYRPIPYVGFAAVARNIGNPAPELGVYSAYGLSATVRPLQERLELSVDYLAADTSAGNVVDNPQQLSGVLRARPVRGLTLRAQADTNPAFDSWRFSGGLELYFGGIGGGAYVVDSGQAMQAALLAGPWEDHIFGQGSRIPIIRLDGSFPYEAQSSLFGGGSQETYLRLLQRMRHAADDPSVEAVVLTFSDTSFSLAQVQEVLAVIAEIQETGKPVIAYLDGGPGNGGYLLASACDEVILHPAGEVSLIGLSSELQYFRGVLDFVGVEPQYAKRAEYKSAPEQWTNTEPSPGSTEQMNALLDDMYEELVSGVAAGRGMTKEEVIALIDKGPFTAREALDNGLVDKLMYPDEVEQDIKDRYSRFAELDDDYWTAPDTSGWVPARQIALVYVTGPINGGETTGPSLFGGGGTGSSTVVRALQQAAENPAVKAVVMRVDSPGGSAFASDEIWRAVQYVKQEGKPVIVSFGGVAASGGYYVASGADVIYAEPSTITGSIGVYGGKFSAGELFEKAGVGTEIFARGRNASMYAMSRPMDDVEYAALDRLIGETYRQFKDRVAEGRGMTPEEVEVVARGRVWSGVDAQQVGLVDELGGLTDAIERARLEAGIPERARVQVVTYKGLEGAWGEEVTETAQAAKAFFQPEIPLPEPLLTMAPYLSLADEHVLLLMPWHIVVE